VLGVVGDESIVFRRHHSTPVGVGKGAMIVGQNQGDGSRSGGQDADCLSAAVSPGARVEPGAQQEALGAPRAGVVYATDRCRQSNWSCLDVERGALGPEAHSKAVAGHDHGGAPGQRR
jgi:hypothetical protein